MNSSYLVEKEEETSGCLTAVHTFGLADVAAVAIAHCAVALHLSNAAAVAVAHGAVTLNLSDAAAVAIAHGSVALKLADRRAVAVAHGTVAFYFSYRRTAAVEQCLCLRRRGKHQQSDDECQCNCPMSHLFRGFNELFCD